ncbi:probable G-protein coupled receptor 139 [Scyliorhinus torazame]|uniref:probable G-protein coupled receptor 139 n=1 Tax=Scyliorhinus torazame TaxID=75743 RepID=UPI003B5C657E
MDTNTRTIDGNLTTTDPSLTAEDWTSPPLARILGGGPVLLSIPIQYLSEGIGWRSVSMQITYTLQAIEFFYYPILAIAGVFANVATIVVISKGNCGLSKCVTRYLLAMAAADLLIVIFDLILRHIPIVYEQFFDAMIGLHLCNIHAVLLYAVTDCSVWFTVTFTFDRFVAICCPKLKSKYCSEKTAAVVLGTVAVLSCLKNIFWYFMFDPGYMLGNTPWFCEVSIKKTQSIIWGTVEFIHYIITPATPFVLILLLNVLTVRHIVLSSRARRRLRAHSSGESPRDPEMESRRKSIILLFIISLNFVLLWAIYMVYFIVNRIYGLLIEHIPLPTCVQELGFMLQLLSCCTNTVIYAISQTKFREQLKNMMKYPFILLMKQIK